MTLIFAAKLSLVFIFALIVAISVIAIRREAQKERRDRATAHRWRDEQTLRSYRPPSFRERAAKGFRASGEHRYPEDARR